MESALLRNQKTATAMDLAASGHPMLLGALVYRANVGADKSYISSALAFRAF
jgi:hypothetical protein